MRARAKPSSETSPFRERKRDARGACTFTHLPRAVVDGYLLRERERDTHTHILHIYTFEELKKISKKNTSIVVYISTRVHKNTIIICSSIDT